MENITHLQKSSINSKNNETNNFFQDNLFNMLTKDDIDLDNLGNILTKRHSQDLSFLEGIEQFSFLKDKALYILPEQNLLEKLENSKKTKKPLVIKFGIDPTGADIHMGHAVPMIMLNRLQRMGHKIAFIIGDFTAKIGDPTGRSSERPSLNTDEIQKNLSTYKEQASPFFNMDKSELFYNSEWLRKKTLENLLEIFSSINVSKVLQREDFRSRLENHQGLTMSELIYPLIMGIDSLELYKKIGCDIEIGGKDQFLNMQIGRTIMEKQNQIPEIIISTDLLEGISGGGKKMSKSLNNYIALNDSPSEIFGKIMSIPDSLLKLYYKTLTDISETEREKIEEAMSKGLNPKEIKKTLAKILTTIIYNKKEAQNAEFEFEQKFGKMKNYRESDIPIEKVSKEEQISVFLTSLLKRSKSEIKNLINGGGISVIKKEGTSIKLKQEYLYKNMEILFNDNEVIILKIGKKNIFKIKKL